MTTAQDDEEVDKNRLQVFLNVERTNDGYIETELGGKRTQYIKHSYPEVVRLENLKTFRSVDPGSGASKYYVTARTEDEFRAIGTERAYRIYLVSLSSDVPVTKAVIQSTYSTGGHPYHTTLHIGLSESALERIVEETRAAPSARNLEVQLKQPSFFGRFREAVGGDTCLFSWWTERPQSKSIAGAIDQIEVTWTLDIASVTVCPASGSSVLSGERDDRAAIVHAVIDRPIGIYYHSDEEDELERQYQKLLTAIEGLRAPLYIIGIAVALVVLKLFIFH
jgi:hypothetical protein